MDYRNLKWQLNNLPDSELSKPVEFYDPYFKRVVRIEGIDHLSSVERGDASDTSSPLVLIGSLTNRQ